MRIVLCVLSMAACFAPKPPNGALVCGDGDSCPDGYRCIDSMCWQNGSGPDMAVPADDLAMPPEDLANADFAVADLSGVDFSGADFASVDLSSVDLAPFVLADTYLSDCVVAPELTASVPNAHKRDVISFNPGHNFGSGTTFYYGDTGCAAPFFTAATSLSSVTESPGPTPDTRFLTLVIQSIQWRPETSAVAQSFNSITNCGISAWAAGVFADVTGRCSPSLPTTGQTFTAYLQLDSGTLEKAGDITSDASAPWPPFGPPLYHTTCKLTAPQAGCAGGTPRCSLPLTPGCVASGALAIGANCDPRSDSCAAGTLCTPTPDGGPTPVCRQICIAGLDCTQPGASPAPSVKAVCLSPLTTVAQKLCTINCNAIPTLGPSGCPSDFNCRVFALGQSNAHVDCSTPVGAGTDSAACVSTNDCASGYDCVNGHCRAYCRTATNADCASGSCVNATGVGAFGHCCPGGTC